MNDMLNKLIIASWIVMLGCIFPSFVAAEEYHNTVVASPTTPLAPQIKGVDADNHTIIVNKPGPVTLLLGTSEDSQDAARAAGKAMYPFQGLSDFQMIVVVDLRDSIAGWVPSIVLEQMRANLDKEAVEIKPYFLRNGNKGNPRESSHVIADFNGSIFPQLGWAESSEQLRGILFDSNGLEIKRWSKIQNMAELQNDVRVAIEIALKTGKAGKKTSGVSTPPKALPVNP